MFLIEKQNKEGTFSNDCHTEEDDKQAAEPIKYFCHFLSFSDPLCNQAQDDSAGESDNQVDNRGDCRLACFLDIKLF